MNILSLREMSFSAFIKMCVSVAVAAAIVCATLLFLLSLVNSASALVSTETRQIDGLPGILIANLTVLLFFAVTGLFTGLLAYYPLVSFLKFVDKPTQSTGGSD